MPHVSPFCSLRSKLVRTRYPPCLGGSEPPVTAVEVKVLIHLRETLRRHHQSIFSSLPPPLLPYIFHFVEEKIAFRRRRRRLFKRPGEAIFALLGDHFSDARFAFATSDDEGDKAFGVPDPPRHHLSKASLAVAAVAYVTQVSSEEREGVSLSLSPSHSLFLASSLSPPVSFASVPSFSGRRCRPTLRNPLSLPLFFRPRNLFAKIFWQERMALLSLLSSLLLFFAVPAWGPRNESRYLSGRSDDDGDGEGFQSGF
jgi:hypothetical protein